MIGIHTIKRYVDLQVRQAVHLKTSVNCGEAHRQLVKTLQKPSLLTLADRLRDLPSLRRV